MISSLLLDMNLNDPKQTNKQTKMITEFYVVAMDDG